MLQLRPINGELDLDLGTTAMKEDGANPKFKFPKLDDATESFLYRRKADLEAAIAHVEAENKAVKAIEADQGSKLRAIR